MAMAQSPMVLQFSFLSLTRGREREGRRRIKNSNLRRSLDLDPRPPPPAHQVLQIFSFRIHLVATPPLRLKSFKSSRSGSTWSRPTWIPRAPRSRRACSAYRWWNWDGGCRRAPRLRASSEAPAAAPNTHGSP